MPGPVIANPTPAGWKPENASVFDSTTKKALRAVVRVLGLDDPQQVMALGVPLEVGPATGGALELVASKLPRLAKVIKAYHGSPHDFEKFDVSKIGTGEGAQAYGHGLYFAENPAVAQDYKNSLARGFEYRGEPVDSRTPIGRTLDFLNSGSRAGEPMEQVLPRRVKELREHAAFLRKTEPNYGSDAMYDRSADLLESLDPKELKRAGRTYEVAINADPDHFLDWDAPLSKQPASAQKAARQFLVEVNGGYYNKATDHFMGKDPTGNQLYRAAQDYREMLFQKAHVVPAGPAGASELFQKSGVPGLKYLDQGSRAVPAYRGDPAFTAAAQNFKEAGYTLDGALGGLQKAYRGADAGELEAAAREVFGQPKQTRNYVVFDDKTVEILRKYGIALPAAGSTLAGLRDQAK